MVLLLTTLEPDSVRAALETRDFDLLRTDDGGRLTFAQTLTILGASHADIVAARDYIQLTTHQ